MANRFSSPSNVKRIDLGDGDWVEIPATLCFNDTEAIQKSEHDIDIFKAVFRAWNLTDASGKVAELNDDTLRTLDIRVVRKVVGEAMSLMWFPKAQKPESGGPSAGGQAVPN
jgi:hypothetical protein